MKTKNEYQKPLMVVETFVAQEYCEQCNVKITSLEREGTGGKVVYLDLDDFGTEERNKERFYNSVLDTATEGTYFGVKAYYLQRLEDDTWKNSDVDVDNGSYTSQFKYYKYTYKFVQIGTGTYDIRVKKDGFHTYAFFNKS